MKDLAGRYLMVNDRAAALLGRTADEVVGTTDHDLMPAEVAEQLRQHDQEVLRHDGPLVLEEPVAVDGEVREFVTRKQPLRDADGRTIGLVGVSTDMSAQALAEELLRRSSAQLAEAQGLTSVGSWHWEVRRDRRSWSDELFRIFGLERGEEALTWDEYLEFVHPDDRDAVRSAFDEAMAGGGVTR